MYATCYMNELYHHGILGQKWGVRRYQNPDGSLTEEGRKRQINNLQGNGKTTLSKGTEFYRISTNKNDLGKDKIYVTANKEQAEFYKAKFGASDIAKSGEAYIQSFVNKNDIVLPNKKTMEKIELKLLKDKSVQKELTESLMKKGMSRAQATEYVQPYRLGTAFMEKSGIALTAAGLTAATGASAATGFYGISLYTGSLATLSIGALFADSAEKTRALNATRVSYGDKNNVITNQKLKEALSSQGYNGMKDYNDRRAFGKKATSATIIFDSEKNLKNTDTHKLSSDEYANAYADYKIKQDKENGVKAKIDRSDYVKDGKRIYNESKDNYIVNSKQKEERERILKEAKKKTS